MVSLSPSPAFAQFLDLFAFFFAVVFLRTQATYWLGRFVTYKTLTTSTYRWKWLEKVADSIRHAAQGRGTRALHKWGLPAVFFSFFMTGTKTVVNAAAGLTQMRFWVWLGPMVLGCIAHAIIYATVGWAAWTAALRAAAGSGWGAAVILIVVAVVCVLVVRALRAKKRRAAITAAIETLDQSDSH